jgi:hypothetical protein
MTRWVLGVITSGLVAAGVTGNMIIRGAEGVTAPKPDSVEFHEGEKFPTTVFPSVVVGRPGSVADFRGKKLILHIFASW